MRLIDERELIRRISELPDLRTISTGTIGKIIKECTTIDAEPVRLRIDTVELNAEKGWYEKQFYCPCGQLIKTEMWDKKYCFGSGTVLKGNIMPKHCPNCGAKMMEV